MSDISTASTCINNESKEMMKKKNISVAVIGCGPGGMFVCHALESKRREWLALGREVDSLPTIVCLEQASAPGGVWRSSSSNSKDDDAINKDKDDKEKNYKTDANMYEALWCNGAKELMEFSDYTFEEHFGHDQALPVYLPRQAVLEYLIQRCTNHCPDFFKKYAKFNTRVERVTYDNTTQQFTVTTTTTTSHKNSATTTTSTSTRTDVQTYDKVLWSAGQNGMGNIPASLKTKFEQAAAATTALPTRPPLFLHACQLEASVAERIRDQHLLLIGGSYSAEDLAFMGIKWGASHITVLARRHGIDVPLCWTTNWPQHKVTVITGQQIDTVQIVSSSSDDTANQLSYTMTLVPNPEEIQVPVVNETHEVVPDTPIILTKVHVVVFCTGYTEHWEMMDKSCFNMTDQQYDCFVQKKDRLQLPQNWTMSHNQLSDFIYKYHHDHDDSDDAAVGFDDEKKTNDDHTHDDDNNPKESSIQSSNSPNRHIPPDMETLFPGWCATPYSYREVLSVYNPNLMQLAVQNYDTPLLALDVQACLALRFITGEQPIPPQDEMMAQNYQRALDEMSVPLIRYWMDTHYRQAVQRWLAETTRRVQYVNVHGTISTRFDYPPQWVEAYRQWGEFQLRLLSRLMQEAEYPLQLGTYEQLNDLGRLFTDIDCHYSRLADTSAEAGTTFRDVPPEQCAKIRSVFTGAVPVPLKGKWLDMDDLMQSVRDLVE
jgi:Flavin-binding monooxygenase-like